MPEGESAGPIERQMAAIEGAVMAACDALGPEVTLDATVPNWQSEGTRSLRGTPANTAAAKPPPSSTPRAAGRNRVLLLTLRTKTNRYARFQRGRLRKRVHS